MNAQELRNQRALVLAKMYKKLEEEHGKGASFRKIYGERWWSNEDYLAFEKEFTKEIIGDDQ